MTIVRSLARPMIASIFIIQGYETMRSPERVVEQAEPVVRSLAEFVDFVPEDPEQAVRLNGAVQLAGGALLAVGWLPRLAALAVAATLVPTTAAGHRFWEHEDPQERFQQRIHFLKNLSMLGGLLVAAGDAGGKPSVAWRGRYRVKSARRELSSAAKAAKVSAKAGARAGRLSSRLHAK